MRRSLGVVILVLGGIVVLAYSYAALRLDWGLLPNILLALPFLSIWAIPVLYWAGEREGKSPFDLALHIFSYVSMGWLSFLFLFLISRDVLLLLSQAAQLGVLTSLLTEHGNSAVLFLSCAAVVWGGVVASRGPCVDTVDIRVEGLPPELEGFRIVQISDLHVGPTIRRSYVERVAALTNEQNPDLIALTGDIVDGTVEELRSHLEPLGALRPLERTFLVLGNHDYYSGAGPWTQEFERLGFRVLQNAHTIIKQGSAKMMVAGVIDPAVRMFDPNQRPDPQLARSRGDSGEEEPDFRLLLAHNPKLAPEGEQAGFDLQLSGHTHAGQFVPWTFVVRLVHKEHYAGLSRRGKMWVYVSAGTGTWGPPIRVGTKPELTLIRLWRA